jgi:hypothetical protein
MATRLLKMFVHLKNLTTQQYYSLRKGNENTHALTLECL